MKNIKFEEIKACPICGNVPYIEKTSLDRGNGHGYPGHYNYQVECKVCGYPKSGNGTTINSSDEKAREFAIANWNAEVDKIARLISKHIAKK